MTAITNADAAYANLNTAALKRQFGDQFLSQYKPTKFKVNSAANSYTAIYGKGQGQDMEEYEVTFTSGGYNAQGKPQNAQV